MRVPLGQGGQRLFLYNLLFVLLICSCLVKTRTPEGLPRGGKSAFFFLNIFCCLFCLFAVVLSRQEHLRISLWQGSQRFF